MKTKVALIYMLITTLCADAGLQYSVITLLTYSLCKRHRDKENVFILSGVVVPGCTTCTFMHSTLTRACLQETNSSENAL